MSVAALHYHTKRSPQYVPVSKALEGEMSLARLMNNTKWEEIRLGMYELGDLSPKWRTKDVENQYICEWDGGWFYHFRNGGYECIEWLEIATTSPEQAAVVEAVLHRIRVPGERIGSIFRIFGYAPVGKPVEYLAPSNNSLQADSPFGSRPELKR